jgi:hypothetical protein
MKRIKKFEGFNYRMPEEYSQYKWTNKINDFDSLPFTEKEEDFFKKLFTQNSKGLSHCNCRPELVSMTYKDNDRDIDIFISKLSDEWYCIFYNPHPIGFSGGRKYYIADEWEEVLGFLKNEINLVF